MAWSCGIVGLPNAGKSTLFKALTGRSVAIENYPFSTIDPNKAIVSLPDRRLKALAELINAEITTFSTIEVIDIAGLVKGASRGEGLGNKFLGHLRDVDILIQVVAVFNEGSLYKGDVLSNIEIINLELVLADLEVVNRRREKIEPKLKSKDKEDVASELQLLRVLESHLNQGLATRDLKLSSRDSQFLSNLNLLTRKNIIYVCNHGENPNPDSCIFPGFSPVFPICANIEAELSDLPDQERQAFMELYGLNESRALVLMTECYNLLGLITFYTIKGKEARSWVVARGITASQAAGKVHSDMEQGFINVEVFPWEVLVEKGGAAAAREKGLSRVEGRDYPVEDGDVLFFRFRA
jgi:hypothetical protein